MIKVIFEDNHIIVVEKPINVPMQEDASKDKDLLTMVKDYLKVKYQKPGNVYLGLVHRLDRPVGGVCVFAKTSKAASRLSRQISEHQFKKEYLAVVENYKLPDQGRLEDYLLKDSKTNMVKVSKDGKKAILEYVCKAKNAKLALVHINLETGRSHQIRVQFASRGWPLYGDQRYNPHAQKGEQIALWAYRLSFYHPTTKQYLCYEAPINRYPFNELGGCQ